MRVLVVDVGNSSIKAGVFVDFYLPVVKRFSRVQQLLAFAEEHKTSAVAVCSVVQDTTKRLKELWPGAFFLDSKNSGIRNLYLTPETIGSDRLANALYIKYFIGTNSIVADIGTAITVDAIGPDGAFYGGAIFPGPEMQFAGLHSRTASLPDVQPVPVPGPLARDTESCIRAGVWWSIGISIAGLASQQAGFLGWQGYRLVLTGGWSGLLREVILGRTRCSLERHASLLGLGAWASDLLK